MHKGTVDLIIPTYKPDKTLRLLLQRLQEQTFVVHKVILVNTGQELWEEASGRNGLKEFLETCSLKVELFHVPASEFDHGGTRRLAVEHSEAEFFICMTQDAVPDGRELVEQILKPFSDELVAAVCARQLPVPGCSAVERFTRSFNYPDQDLVKSKRDIEKYGIKTFFCSNVCAAYRRSIYETLGGFETQAVFNEDMIYAGHAVMAGYRLAYASGAKVVHSHNYTGMQQFRRNFDLAVSQIQHPEVFAQIKSESEGIRLVKMTARHLLTIKKPWLILDLVWKSACKLLGYRKGRRYRSMSHGRILRCTMNRNYWLKRWKAEEDA